MIMGLMWDPITTLHGYIAQSAFEAHQRSTNHWGGGELKDLDVAHMYAQFEVHQIILIPLLAALSLIVLEDIVFC